MRQAGDAATPGRCQHVRATKLRLLCRTLALRRWRAEAGVPADPQPDLDIVLVWYNYAQNYQGLAGRTPFESWSPSARGPLRFFLTWNGLLTGFGRST